MKIASWSGPRNISTALMYSFAARGDVTVRDEPFYAPYLSLTRIDHPLRDEILARHESDPSRVIAGFDRGSPHLYLKLMAQHMVDGIDMSWARDFTHLHLVRHPARVIASYAAKRQSPTLEDLGYPRQLEIFEAHGGLVVLGSDIRQRPEAMLRAICERLGLPFTRRMLRWPKGGHPADGVWAGHWYQGVHASTTFAGQEAEVLPELQGSAANVCSDALAYYDALAAHRITPD